MKIFVWGLTDIFYYAISSSLLDSWVIGGIFPFSFSLKQPSLGFVALHKYYICINSSLLILSLFMKVWFFLLPLTRDIVRYNVLQLSCFLPACLLSRLLLHLYVCSWFFLLFFKRVLMFRETEVHLIISAFLVVLCSKMAHVSLVCEFKGSLILQRECACEPGSEHLNHSNWPMWI